MTQEYISRTWLMQNIRMDMKIGDAAKVIENAPIVEFDTDEPPARGRCEKCKHRIGVSCRYWMGFTEPDDWCSHFMRRAE